MTRRTRRTLSLLCLSVVLCLPLQAQPRLPQPADALSGFLSSLWERVSAPLASLWAADETDGRGAVDPDGQPVPTTDGRGACDPDGAPACGS